MLWLLGGLVGCGCGEREAKRPPDPTEPAVAFEPGAATMYRLTDAEWRNSVEDLLGVRFEGTLPVDYVLHGYTRVGASELTVPPLDLELYEAAAWAVAEAALPDAAARDARLGCDGADPVCARGFAAGLARRAWRRPPTTAELDLLEDLHGTVLAGSGPDLAARAIVAAILVSPAFTFRVERGQSDPDHDGRRRYTSLEMAGRLASFLTASVPDEELLRAGEAGELLETRAIEAQALRLLETPRARAAMTAFFGQTLELQDLDARTKDAAAFPGWTDALRAEMALELELLFQALVLDEDADLGELLTTDRTFVGPALAALYGVPPDATTLPAADARGGLLGRAGVLALQAHHSQTSPTHRGRFVRTRLLCGSIPPPPPDVTATLDALGTEGTLRDRLEQHVDDPVCASCHVAMDPIGFALEHFDPIGARRELDNGLPIDATGEIDGVAFDGAAELGAVLAAHPEYGGCWALQVYRSANGQAERLPELVAVDAITAGWEPDGRVFRELVLAVVTSEAFRTTTGGLGETCDLEGETRSCATDCGPGTEVCADGRWRACTAPAPDPETCDGLDQDCDGEADEGLERACAATFGTGTERCEGGAWTPCAQPGPPDEVCNGADDDGDGAVDEDLAIRVVPATYAALAEAGCDPLASGDTPACKAAASRTCAEAGCAVTGLGPLELRPDDTDLVCLDGAVAALTTTSFTELGALDPGCTPPVWAYDVSCKGAVHALCDALGLVTGFGPVEIAGDEVVVACTPGAILLDTSYTELVTWDLACNGTGERAGSGCDRAIHGWCRDRGHASGHGPIAYDDDLAVVACLEAP